MTNLRIQWIVPESAGGIRSYSEGLLSVMGNTVRVNWELPSASELLKSDSQVFHLQHEFGLFGSKIPGLNRFPGWYSKARDATQGKKWIATAHTVLDDEWCYRGAISLRTKLLQGVLNWIVPAFRKSWTHGTWGRFDGVVVHSELQKKTILESGCKKVAVIPHYVPPKRPTSEPKSTRVTLFGYFSKEKGQDIAIDAWAILGERAPPLVLAGGVRRHQDEEYYQRCLTKIRDLGLSGRIEVSGFVPKEEVSSKFEQSTIVLAPFRETSGSGSLATALAHGAVIIASDLPLNREITNRVPGCLKLFSSNSPAELAKSIDDLIHNPKNRSELRKNALLYAEKFSPEKVAMLYWDFYREVTRSNG